MTTQQALELAIHHHQAGRLTAEVIYRQILAVEPRHPDALHLLGIIAHIELKPDYPEAHANLGNTLKEQGRIDDAIAACRRALQLKPDCAEAYSILGSALRDKGQIDDAISACCMALNLKPDYPEAHLNLGNALRDKAQNDDAIHAFRQALQFRPDHAEAHNNLGSILHRLGRLDEAEASYRRALQIKPDCVEAHRNLAFLLNARGEAFRAWHIIKQGVRIKETADAKRTFVDCVKHLRWTHHESEDRRTMVRALTEPWGRPGELVRSSVHLLKLDQGIATCMARAAAAWPLRLSAQDLFGSNGLATLAANDLLCAILHRRSATSRWSVFLPWPGVPCLKPPQG